MMMSPDSSWHDSSTAEPVRWVRGTCPDCGSDQVIHHVIGMPLPEVMDASPPWVVWEGCCGPVPERRCTACGHEWWPEDVGFAEEDEPTIDLHDGVTPAPPAPVRVVGAVLVDGERILAARRHPDRSAGGRWEFPGGKIERGESPQGALIRELTEELGVEVTVGRLIGRGIAAAGERELHLDCYWTRLTGEAPTTGPDHDQLAWLRREDLGRLTWAAADVPIVERILAGTRPVFGTSD